MYCYGVKVNNAQMEETLIDSERFETTFEEHGDEYDRFSYVVVFNLDGEYVDVVPYLYARSIVYNLLTVIPVDRYPSLTQWSVHGELLQLCSHAPKTIIRLVNQRVNILNDLHQELNDLQTVGIMEQSQLSFKFQSYLKLINVGSHTGEGVFWLPENYMEDESDMVREYEEGYEEYMRRRICGHIRARPLPMAHLIPISHSDAVKATELVDKLGKLSKVENTHLVTLFKDRHLSHNGLKTLMLEEFRCVKNELPIDGNSSFVFNREHLSNGYYTVPYDDACQNLRYYVGNYFDDLDLSQTFITGSAISASIIRSSLDGTWSDRDNLISLFYPPIITVLSKDDLAALQEDNIALWNMRLIDKDRGIITKNEVTYHFEVKSGADVDMAIDITVSDEEYYNIVKGHYETIKRYYPYVKIRQHLNARGNCNYIIYTDDPQFIPIFRTVEIYRSSFRNICSHHVGAVRGCYTARWSEEPQFYLTASAVYTSHKTSTPNYHYFAGRKSNPQDIIIKNMQRGIGVSDCILKSIVDEYMNAKHINISKFPFYKGKNVKYSIFSAPLEYPKIREILQREREIREQEARREEARAHRRQLARNARLQRERERQAERQLWSLFHNRVDVPVEHLEPGVTLYDQTH